MKKSVKNLLVAFLLFILITIYVYICAIDAIPNNIIIFKGEELNIKTIFGITLVDTRNQSILASTTLEEENVVQDTSNVEVKLFNTFKVKEVGVSIIERATVIPVGQISGLKLYINGVLVVGMSEVKGTDNEKYKPYDNSGIQEGDLIVEVDNISITNTNKLVETINASNGEAVKITYVRDNETLQCNMIPVQTDDDEYKIGLWVRDGAAGIGTMTYYEPSTGNFAALGHGITDVDTGELLDISNGEFITTKILSVVKGKEGNPGKIQGSIKDQTIIGRIYKNTNLGIYGEIDDVIASKIDLNKEMEVATRDEIQLGDATIICSIDDEQPKEYNIKIEKIYINNDYDNKSMFIKITDQELLEKTGGIIQGMSGSPVIQNGKFIGAVTNVLVNDPTRGYAVFGDLMIKEMRTIE